MIKLFNQTWTFGSYIIYWANFCYNQSLINIFLYPQYIIIWKESLVHRIIMLVKFNFFFICYSQMWLILFLILIVISQPQITYYYSIILYHLFLSQVITKFLCSQQFSFQSFCQLKDISTIKKFISINILSVGPIVFSVTLPPFTFNHLNTVHINNIG